MSIIQASSSLFWVYLEVLELSSQYKPAGMYASQIWATAYLQQGTEMDNCIQKWLLSFLRSMLGVRTSTPSWSVL
eukprot:1144835-Pelagomonas_calceolata.AAC.1